MKTASLALTDFLLNAQSYVRADLYTIALAGGGALRYTSADTPIVANGQTFALGPPCQDGGVKSSRGVTVSTVDITFLADDRHLVGGAQFLDFVEDLGLDGAAIRIDRAFAASWADMARAGPVGTYIRFSAGSPRPGRWARPASSSPPLPGWTCCRPACRRMSTRPPASTAWGTPGAG